MLRPPDAGAEGINTWPGKRWGPHCALRKGRWALKRWKQPASSLLGAEADFCPKCGSETRRPQGLAMRPSRKAGCVDVGGCVNEEGNNCIDGWELRNSGSVLVDQGKDIAHTHTGTHYLYHTDTLLIPYTLHTHPIHTTHTLHISHSSHTPHIDKHIYYTHYRHKHALYYTHHT